ncbi:BrnT family toxin [Treponema sp. TIM-1]|uniref:BrnT family toxin n=1 Tax=Treponema sp. TIM-1 TaxID=2898417 RepID=UPI00397FC94B
MEECRIAWDEAKNAENKLKHKIGFEDAQFVFADPDRIERIDRSDSNTSGETRWQTIGRVGSLLFVVYTESREETRLITAREAEKHERRSYHGYYHIDGKGWTKAT